MRSLNGLQLYILCSTGLVLLIEPRAFLPTLVMCGMILFLLSQSK